MLHGKLLSGSWRLRALASYCMSSWMIHGTVSGLHRTSFVSAVSAPGSPCSNNTLNVTVAEDTHSWTRTSTSIHNAHMGRSPLPRTNMDIIYMYIFSWTFSLPPHWCSTQRQKMENIIIPINFQVIPAVQNFCLPPLVVGVITPTLSLLPVLSNEEKLRTWVVICSRPSSSLCSRLFSSCWTPSFSFILKIRNFSWTLTRLFFCHWPTPSLSLQWLCSSALANQSSLVDIKHAHVQCGDVADSGVYWYLVLKLEHCVNSCGSGLNVKFCRPALRFLMNKT